MVLRCRQDSLRLLQWNAGGLTQSKRGELLKVLRDKNIDVFTLMEANKKKEDMDRFPFPGYNIFILEKSRKVASGLIIGIRDTITSSFEVIKLMGETDDKVEIARVNCWLNHQHFKIFCIYNPPNNKPNLDLIEVVKKTIVIGDFNAHSQTWGYRDRDSVGDMVEEFMNSTSLELVYNVKDPKTFLHYNGTSSNPDLLMVSADLHDLTHRSVLEDCGSGHRMVLANITMSKEKRGPRPIVKVSWNFRKADWTSFRDYLETELDETRIDFDNHPEKITSMINNKIIHAAKRYIPRGRQRNYRCFWNDRLTDLKNKRDELRDKAQSHKDPQVVQDWRKSAAVLAKEITDAKRSAFDKYITNLNYKTEAKKAFKYINKLCSGETKVRKEPFKSNAKMLCDDTQIANTFVNYFSAKQRKSTKMKKRERVLKLLNAVNRTLDTTEIDICNKDFSDSELEMAIAQLKTGKSPGCDHIFAEYILHMGEKSRRTLLRLFNKIWNGLDAIPSLWKKATIIPILKKDKPASDFNAYRPISLTSVMSKVMERLVTNRLNWLLETKELLHPAQAGFRKNRSTEEHVAFFAQSIKDNIDKGNIVCAVFVDFKGAYDTVWKSKLINKLAEKNINGKMLRWFRDFLGQRYVNVRYGTSSSRFRQLHTGIPQGAVSSCMLFNAYVDDLIQTLIKQNVEVLMYADDLVFWTSSTKKNAAQILEKKLNNAMIILHSWCVDNNMIVNTEKTVYQTFSLCHKPLQLQIVYNNNPLPSSESTKYLGVTFDRKLTWKHHIDDIKERSETRMRILKRLAGVKWGSSTSTLHTTFKTFIKPVITYSAAPLITASQSQIDRLERTQNQALRLVTGAVRSTPIDALLLNTGEMSIKYDIEKSALKLYQKLIRMPHSIQWATSSLAPRRLKTQEGFLQVVLREMPKFNFPADAEPIMRPVNPLEVRKILYHLDLLQPVSKTQDCTNVLLGAGMETIYVRFPPENWMHVYTDGSKLDIDGNAGAGIHSENFSHYLPLGPTNTAFDGEVAAIKTTLQHLNGLPSLFEQAVIFSDSQAAILSIANCFQTPVSASIQQCRSLFWRLYEKGKIVVLQWIPSHCGIPGNETADQLAKKGCTILQTLPGEICYTSATQKIKLTLKHLHASSLKERTKEKPWNKTICNLPDYPRYRAVAAFRITTGHDCLFAHLHRLKIVSSPACPLCSSNCVMTADHLPLCPALKEDSLYSRYWEARELLFSLVP